MSRNPQRYGIYLADLDPTRGAEIAKRRPVVVVSLEAMNRYLGTVVVCPLTTRLHPRWRSRVPCVCAGRKSEVAVDQIRAITKERLGTRIDRLTAPAQVTIRALISEMYGEAESEAR